MGALLASLLCGLAAFLFYKAPTDWCLPYLRWWKSEEEAEEIQQEVKWVYVMIFGGIAVLCLGLQLIQWWTDTEERLFPETSKDSGGIVKGAN